MSPPIPSRRDFLASLGGAAVAAGVLPTALGRSAAAVGRGLARAPDDFLLSPGLAYLRTGSIGPTPRPVMDASIRAWRELETNPLVYTYDIFEKALDAVRGKAATFLGCATEELVLTNCTTEGMNWVAQGAGLGMGDHVLTTDQEHPGGRACWDYVVRKQGVVLDIVPIAPSDHDPGAIIERFARQITPRTRILSFSHLLSSTGLRMPVAELCALARQRGCLAVVDGAQAVGNIDVDLKALGCHAYATSGRKWLLGPKGTGLLYLSTEIGRSIDPIALQGGRAAYSESSGVCSLPSVIGLGAALDYIDAIGRPRVEAHNLALRRLVYQGLLEVPKVEVVSAASGPMASPLVTYRLPPEIPSRELQQRLMDRHGVVVKVVPTNWMNGQRISTHLFNDERDVAALLAALRAELS